LGLTVSFYVGGFDDWQSHRFFFRPVIGYSLVDLFLASVSSVSAVSDLFFSSVANSPSISPCFLP
jgi:hypothetical protein